jgi:UDP-N-acetyl-D-mannosaminuronic acid dehydrogenase
VNLSELQQKIEQRQAVIGVIGLGYVGFPVACTFADVGFEVIGLETKPERVEMINAGQNPIEGIEPGLPDLVRSVVNHGCLHATCDYTALTRADVVLIDVETPVDETHQPNYAALKAACGSLGAVLKAGTLVIVESTLAPGTMKQVVQPLLEQASGKQVNVDFYLGTCPERVMPGKLLTNLRRVSRVCGGSTPEAAQVMIALYRTIVDADLDAADCVTAELVKTAENAYRDVNIAFANELALVCEFAGGDFLRVRELVNKSPGRNILLAGAGVGGHCIPKDPWLLAYGARGHADLHLIPAARTVNDDMPHHVFDLLCGAFAQAGLPLAGAKVAVLGYAYLEDSGDIRNSPSAALIKHLSDAGVEVVIHDPWVAAYRDDALTVVQHCDAAVLMVAHTAYRSLALSALKVALRTPILVDGRRFFPPQQAQAVGLIYRAIGWRLGA